MTEIFAFGESEADYTLVDGYILSFYDTELDNPYAVEDSNEKIHKAIEEVDLDSYSFSDDEHWIRIDYQSILDGNPEKITHE